MSQKILNLAILFFLLFVIGEKASAQNSSEVGRYQLFQAKYIHYDLDQNTSAQNEELFMIDTASGDVQMYYSQIKGGKQTKYWAPAVFDETKSSFNP